jgi:nucleoside-diphosphate-sugar epimerase
MKNILITGGSGYVGSRLIFKLLEKSNINIFNYDISFYGSEHLLNKDSRLKNLFFDIRNLKKFEEVIINNKIDIVLHLACISNDPSYVLNSNLSKEINYDCFSHLVKISKKNRVKKFIYASTSSVYGVAKNSDVKEDNPLVPITDYNKYKALCEPELLDEVDKDFHGIILRPSTVCGYSEKMRFDLTVNILTNFAYHKKYIKVFGGDQYRPNIHIDDMCEIYLNLIFNDTAHVNGQIFNAGIENLKVIEIAKKVKKIVEARLNENIEIITTPSDDIRSYQVNSEKIKKLLPFVFKKNVDQAIIDLVDKFEDQTLKDTFSDKWINLSILKSRGY